MARKMLTREITTTTVKAAKMTVVDGQPTAETLEDVLLVGNVTLEKANKELKKMHGEGTTVFTVIPETKQYEMPVDVFLQYATIKVAE
jgi:hypothetical protein